MRWPWLTALCLFLSVPVAAAQPPTAAQVRAAEEALSAMDHDRFQRDEGYAGTIADHLIVLQAAPGLSDARRAALRNALVYALAAAGRHDSAEEAADALLREQPNDADAYDLALIAAQGAERWPRLADIIERALASLAPEDRAGLLSIERVSWLMRAVFEGGDSRSRARIAEVLLAAGWPGESAPLSAADSLRLLLIDRALERGETAAARGLAAEVQGLGTALRLATDRRYDPLMGTADRMASVRSAIDREDRLTAARLAAAPEDIEALVDRATFLRSIGRDPAVLDLLLPLMSDVRIVAGRHSRGLWLVNEAAYSLIATGAAGEAVELMRPLFELDVDANPELVNTSINFVGILWQAGRSEEALERANSFMAASARHASDYGKMWIFANAVCAATELRRTADSAAWLERAAPIADSNRSAMLQALLCRGDMDAAERVLLGALGDEENRGSAILWLQDYQPVAHADAAQRLREAFLRLRARPAIEAELARLGHRLRLPIPAVLHGWY
jgi:hypothetical protein